MHYTLRLKGRLKRRKYGLHMAYRKISMTIRLLNSDLPMELGVGITQGLIQEKLFLLSMLCGVEGTICFAQSYIEFGKSTYNTII